MRREDYRRSFIRMAAAMILAVASLMLFPQAAEASGQAEENIHIEAAENGTISADSLYAQEGEQVTLTVTPSSGQALSYLKVTDSADRAVETRLDKGGSTDKVQTYTFAMPADPVNVTGIFSTQKNQQIWISNSLLKSGRISVRMYDKTYGTEAFSKIIGGMYEQFYVTDGTYICEIRDPEGRTVYRSFEMNINAAKPAKVDIIYSVFNLHTNELEEGVNTAIKNVTMKNTAGEEIPFFEKEKVTNDGTYSWWQYSYFLFKNENCKLKVEMEDEKIVLDEHDCIPKSSQTSIQLAPKKYAYRLKFPKDADARLYRHMAVSYQEFVPVEWSSRVESGDGYEEYTAMLLPDRHYVVITGGEGSKYRKRSTWLNPTSRDGRLLTIELNEKTGGIANLQAPPFTKGNDLYTAVRGTTMAGDGKAASMYLCMKPGTTGELEGFRVWQTVDDATGNTFVEPDMHYEIVSGDSVRLEAAGGPGREYQKVIAEKEGTTVIKVTYDDMENEDVAGAALIGLSELREQYYIPPIDGANTGIVIINVGGSDEGITSGIEATDYDTQYFAEETILPGVGAVSGNSSVPYSFSPSAESGIKSVRVRTPYREGDWNDPKAWQELTAEDGVYTAQLYDGRNIVEITDQQDHVLYQAINAKAVTVTVENATIPGEPLAVGDEAHVSITGLELPVYKMCAVYNPGFPDTIWAEYTLNDGRKVESAHGQYNIHVPKNNMISFIVQQEGENKIVGGRIHATHMGDPLGSHLNINKDGLPPNFNAEEMSGKLYYSALPEITFNAGGASPWHQVVSLIAKIDPDDYLSGIRTIMDARAAYDRLSAGDKAKVTNYERLTTAEADPAVGRTIPVVRKIDALPDSASLADEGAIWDADQAYRSLYSDAERNGADKATGSRLAGLVSRLEQLIAEEARRARIDAVSSLIAGLPGEDTVTGEDAVIAAINDAKRAYDALSAGEQAEVAGAAKLTGLVQSLPDLNAANNVIHAIAAIGGVTQEDYLEKTAAVEQAASLYRNLTERQQGYVSNRDVLERVQYDIDYYGAEQAVRPVMEKLAALREALAQMQASGKPAGEGWIQWKEQIGEAQGAYDALTDSQKESLADYAGVLEDARAYTRQAEADEVAAMIGALPAPETVEEYGQPQGQLTQEQVAAIAAAQNALQALTQEEIVLLPEGAQEKLLALVEEAKTYPGYTGAYLKPYIEEFTADCQRYQETGVLRKDMETITALLERYDSYTPEEQAVLDQSLAEMAGWLRGEAQRISGEVQATDELNGKIQALPSTVDIQAWQGILEEIQAIEAGYEALSADAKGYVTGMARLESLKAQVRVFQAQAAQFQAAIPAVTAVADTPTQVTLTWDRCADATSYRIYRKEGRGGWKELTVTGALSYVDRDVKGSTTYTYAVRALSTKWGQTVESAMDEDGTAVTTPFGTVTKLKSARAVRYDRVTLTWTRCADASGYEVYRAEAVRGTYKKVKTLRGSGTVTWTDTKLRTGRTYFYKIKAYRTQGGQVQRAGDSNVKSAKPTLSAAVLGKVSAGRKRATVSWKKVNGASGYVLYRSTKKNGGYKAIKTVKKAAAGRYTDKKLKTGKTYYYRMRAYRTVDGKRVYGGYSKTGAVKVR